MGIAFQSRSATARDRVWRIFQQKNTVNLPTFPVRVSPASPELQRGESALRGLTSVSPVVKFEKLKTLFWRLPTFPVRVSSALPSLTSVFGMRTGVTLALRHQNKIFNLFTFQISLRGKSECSRFVQERSDWLQIAVRQSFSVGGRTGVTLALRHQNKVIDFLKDQN